MRLGFRVRAVAMTCASMGCPASGCSTLGRRECMRLPWPAASITTSGRMAIEKLSHKHRLTIFRAAFYALRDIRRQRGALRGREVQAGLGAPPQYIVRIARPFARQEVVHLPGVEVGAEVRPHRLDAGG